MSPEQHQIAVATSRSIRYGKRKTFELRQVLMPEIKTIFLIFLLLFDVYVMELLVVV